MLNLLGSSTNREKASFLGSDEAVGVGVAELELELLQVPALIGPELEPVLPAVLQSAQEPEKRSASKQRPNLVSRYFPLQPQGLKAAWHWLFEATMAMVSHPEVQP
ncbi:MAG: hypothetical protein U0519_01620 [Candidatus Gracilibacteria bacterium]